jgi:hypothetical protein
MEPHGLYDQNIDNLLMHIEQTQNAYYVAMDIVNFVHILIFMVSFCLILSDQIIFRSHPEVLFSIRIQYHSTYIFFKMGYL